MKKLDEYTKVLKPNTKLFTEGDITQEIYILLNGKIEIIKEGKTLYITEEEGAFIGEMGAILNITRSATAITRSVTRLLEISPLNFENIIKTHPDIALKLIKLLASRLYETTKRFSALVSKDQKSSSRLEDRSPIFDIVSEFHEICPKDVQTLLVLGYYKYTRKDFENSKKHLENALEVINKESFE